MAKSKKYIPEVVVPEKYYAYFNPDTEKFISVSNVFKSEFPHYALISKQDYKDICLGKLKLLDLNLKKLIDFDGTISYELENSHLENEFNFQSRLLEWVSEPPVTDTEFIIEWNKLDRQWVLYVTDYGRDMLSGSMYDSTLAFFVMLEVDFDFLIRTFFIKLHTILKDGKIVYNFQSDAEANINNLSIATKRVFNNYGLKIND
jgi:hypothetical protein